MKAFVDSRSCNGCGICEIVCPEVFRMNGGEHKPFAVVHSALVPEEAIHYCRDAVECCKPGAIQLLKDIPAVKRK